LRLATTTSAPRAAKPSAIARPSPLLPPGSGDLVLQIERRRPHAAALASTIASTSASAAIA
jgi:hypothetical protein